MADLKRITDKIKKPLFWRGSHPPAEAELPRLNPVTPERAIRRKWYRSGLVKFAGGSLVLCLFVPSAAHGQFGIDVAAIIAALSKVESLMSTYVAAPLKDINQTQQSISKYEQQVIYPVAVINQAKSSVTQFENQFSQIGKIFRVNVSSATLPQSQGLESLLLSRNAGNVSSVSSQFQNVYGAVMPTNAASPQVRNMTDTTDAQALDAMKRAIATDALADAEIAEADQIGQQIAAAAPGSASILEAEADVWVVRANAYTQSALAELMRTHAIDIANQSKLAKLGASDNSSASGLINGALTRH